MKEKYTSDLENVRMDIMKEKNMLSLMKNQCLINISEKSQASTNFESHHNICENQSSQARNGSTILIFFIVMLPMQFTHKHAALWFTMLYSINIVTIINFTTWYILLILCLRAVSPIPASVPPVPPLTYQGQLNREHHGHGHHPPPVPGLTRTHQHPHQHPASMGNKPTSISDAETPR